MPLVTIAVPVSNRGWALPTFIHSVLSLTYPKERIRIVFADNLSQDDGPRILSEFKQQWNDRYEKIVILSRRSSLPEARNLCVENSVGEYLLFLDSDVLPPPEAVERLLKLIRKNPRIGIVAFPYIYEILTFKEAIYLHSKPSSPHIAPLVGMGCALVKNSLFKEVGKFNPLFTRMEDVEFTMRARRARYLTLLDGSKRLKHLSKSAPASIPKYRWGLLPELMPLFRFTFVSSVRGYPAGLYGLQVESEVIRRDRNLATAIPLASLVALGAPMRIIITLLLTLTYTLLRILHLPRSTGEWHAMNSPLMPAWGISFAKQIFEEGLEFDLLGRSGSYPGLNASTIRTL